MLVPILLVGAAAVGAWYLLKDDSKPSASGETPKVPEMPPGDIDANVDVKKGFIPSTVSPDNFYMVAWGIYPLGTQFPWPYVMENGIQYYSDLTTAKQSYDTLALFFTSNYQYWTCNGKGIIINLVQVQNHVPMTYGQANWEDC